MLWVTALGVTALLADNNNLQFVQPTYFGSGVSSKMFWSFWKYVTNSASPYKYHKKGSERIYPGNVCCSCTVCLTNVMFLCSRKICENMNCSETMWRPPLERTHWELSFEWSHPQIFPDSSGCGSLLFQVKFIFGSETVRSMDNCCNKSHYHK